MDYRELRALDLELQRKLNLLRMHTEDKEFNYQQPEMIYDKKTGDVKIIERNANEKKNIIRSMDDLEKERQALNDEISGKKTDLSEPEVQAAAITQWLKDSDVDPQDFPVISRDGLRVDVGLIVQRPPIFAHVTKRDMDFMKARSQIMNEFHCNHKEFVNEFNEVSKLNEDLLAENPYTSTMNLDNFPTHKSGEETYAAASKRFSSVDPACEDVRSLHYAGEDRVYLILKNKHTQEWEFPTVAMNFGQSFMRAK